MKKTLIGVLASHKNNGVRSSFLTVFRHNVKNEDLTLGLFQPQHLPYLLKPWASLCCANSPGNWALYAVSVRRLIALHSGLPLPLVALAYG
jgi:hypothetical protein